MRTLFKLNPGPWRWRLGVQAGVAMALTIGAWTLAGYQSFGLVASLGVFAILYGVEWSKAERAYALPLFAIGLVAASAIGVACSVSILWSVIGVIGVTVLATAVTLLFGIGPPGPLMFILVSSVSGYIAEHAKFGGGPLTPPLIPVLVACGAAIAYLVAMIPMPWFPDRTPPRAARTPRELFRPGSLNVESRAIGARVIIGASLAALLGAQIGIQRVYWMVVPAVAILQKSHSPQITTSRALHRVIGTVAGLGVFALVHPFLRGGFEVVAFIALAQCIVEIVVARNYALGLVFVTPLALTISTAGHQANTGSLMSARLIDTALGAGIALAVLGSSHLLSRRN